MQGTLGSLGSQSCSRAPRAIPVWGHRDKNCSHRGHQHQHRAPSIPLPPDPPRLAQTPQQNWSTSAISSPSLQQRGSRCFCEQLLEPTASCCHGHLRHPRTASRLCHVSGAARRCPCHPQQKAPPSTALCWHRGAGETRKINLIKETALHLQRELGKEMLSGSLLATHHTWSTFPLSRVWSWHKVPWLWHRHSVSLQCNEPSTGLGFLEAPQSPHGMGILPWITGGGGKLQEMVQTCP